MVAIILLLTFRYRYATAFPTFIAVMLFSFGAHRDIFRVLSRIGLSISYTSTRDKLSDLAHGQAERLKEWGKSLASGIPFFQFAFDNINKRRRMWQSTIAQCDEVQSGTAATAIKLEDVPVDAFSRKALEDYMQQNPRSTLTVQDLWEDIDWEHLRGVGSATVLRVWIRWIPALARFRPDVEKLFTEKHQKHRL